MTATTATVGNISADRLRSLIERIESLQAEKADLSADISDIFKEAKSAGFDAKAMRTIIAERKLSEADRQEREHYLDTYRRALAGLVDMPLGEAAMDAASRAKGAH